MDTFGAGALYAIPLADASGNQITIPSPVEFGILQDVTIDDSYEIKELYGANAFPVDIGRGKGKKAIKAKFASINAKLFNSVFFGQTLVAGYEALYQDLIGTTIPTGAGATSVHITPPTAAIGGGTSVFVRDLGVKGLGPTGDVGGVPFTRVASSPTSGQYSLAGSTYTFSDIDVGKTVFISYDYTNATNPATAETLTEVNLAMGSAPTFQAVFMAKRQTTGETYYLRFPNCVATKLTRDYKNDDFTISDFEATAFADANGNISYQAFYV